MGMPEHPIQLIDYRQEQASDGIVPRPALLASSGWNELHLELHHQPTFETAEHEHTMHVIAAGLANSSTICASGVRWLDGKLERERRLVGDIAVIPAGIAHRCSWDKAAQFMVLAIEPNLLQQLSQDWVNPDQIELMPQFMSHQDGFIQRILATLREEVEMGGWGSQLLVDSLKTALGIHLLRNYCATRPKLSDSTTQANGLSKSVLNLVIDYINSQLHQNLQLDQLAAIAQISPYHFLRLFKQSTGMTPHQYILQCRIERSKLLLKQGDLAIAEIAIQTGFCDQSHLTRHFKRSLGVTPRQFLKAHAVRSMR